MVPILLLPKQAPQEILNPLDLVNLLDSLNLKDSHNPKDFLNLKDSNNLLNNPFTTNLLNNLNSFNPQEDNNPNSTNHPEDNHNNSTNHLEDHHHHNNNNLTSPLNNNNSTNLLNPILMKSTVLNVKENTNKKQTDKQIGLVTTVKNLIPQDNSEWDAMVVTKIYVKFAIMVLTKTTSLSIPFNLTVLLAKF